MNDNPIITAILNFVDGWRGLATSWVVQVFIIVFCTLLIHFVLRRILNRLHKKAVDSKAYWDDVVVLALRKPLAFLVLIVGMSFALDIVRGQAGMALLSVVGPLRVVGVIAMLAWFLVRLISEGELGIIAKYEEEGEP